MSAQQYPGSFLPRVATEPEALRRSWVIFAFLGGALIVLGGLALGAAFVTTLATVVVFGSLLLVAGVLEILNSLWARAWRGFFLHQLAGVLYAVVGLLMIEHPVGTAAGVTLVVATLLLVGGLFRVIVSAVERFEGWMWSLCSGIVALLLGVLIWREWPASGLWVIGLFVGIELIMNGWTWLMLAFALKGLSSKGTPGGPPRPDEEVRAEIGHA